MNEREGDSGPLFLLELRVMPVAGTPTGAAFALLYEYIVRHFKTVVCQESSYRQVF